MQIISAGQIRAALDWEGVLQALHEAHLGPALWATAISSAMRTTRCSAGG